MLIGNYQSTSSALAHTLVALHLVTATAFAASAPVDGLRWTAEDLPLPGGVSSLVATGSTKEGVIIAHARGNYHVPTLIRGGPMRATPSPQQAKPKCEWSESTTTIAQAAW